MRAVGPRAVQARAAWLQAAAARTRAAAPTGAVQARTRAAVPGAPAP
ncbi:hypothetical protein [Streptomyces sp. DH-12]|nr:hypothetical protein [Streptomyces sp. DH-12]